MHDTPAVSVVVSALNAAETLPRTLAALAAQDLAADYEVIVVDNGSRDATAEVARAARGPVRVVPRSSTALVGQARNEGVAAARADVLAFTDADCFPEPGWLAAGLRALEEAELVQGRVDPDPNVPLGPYDRTLVVDRDRGYYQTANLFVRRADFDAVGGFEDFAVDGPGLRPFGEDTLLGWRLIRRGARSTYAADALVHHAVFAQGPLGFVALRRRWRFLPAVAKRVPELRGAFFYHRVFLERHTAFFDAALAGLAAAAVLRRPAPALLAAPYAWILVKESAGWGARAGPPYALVRVAGDVVATASLAWGSVSARAPVL